MSPRIRIVLEVIFGVGMIREDYADWVKDALAGLLG